jgi:membrane protease YdiL (CAAX protease family)
LCGDFDELKVSQLENSGRAIRQGTSVNQRISEWIRRYPIEAFFLLGIAICYVTLFPAILIIPQETTLGQVFALFLGRIGVYSPVLAGIFVSRILRPARQQTSLSRRLLVFLPAWFIAAIIHTASLNLEAEPGTPIIALIAVSLPVALLPAFVITLAFSGTDGVKQMLSTLVKPKGSIAYYLVALLAFPAIHVVGTGITNVLNGDRWFPHIFHGSDLALTVLITFFSVLFFSGGINEESGWRGFAQPRLQAKYSPLIANLFLWVLLVIWHIPNDIVQYQDGGYLLVRIGLYPFITILLGWIYNRTKGSILAPAIFHASMNSMNPLVQAFPITIAGSILLVGSAVAVVIWDRMWRRLPEDHPAVFQDAVTATATVSSERPLAGADSEC